MKEKEKTSFSFTYSSVDLEEINRIKQKYISQEENKLEQLQKLDKNAEKPGTIFSLVIGIIGMFLLGIGLCCTIEWTDYFVIGIVVGVVGLLMMGASYPLYLIITKRQRQKIAPLILKLTDELL